MFSFRRGEAGKRGDCMPPACSGFRWIRTGPFSCKPLLESFSGWVVSYFVLRQKAILHHLICSSHANKRGGNWIGRTRLLLLPTTLPTHGALSDYGKRITTTPLCLLVSLMGEAGEHHSPPVIGPVQVLMPLRGCVSFSISPCQPTYTYSLRTSVLLKLSIAYISALPLSCSQSLWPYEVCRVSLIYCSWKTSDFFFFFCPSVALYINIFVPAISLAKAIMQMLS